MFEGLNDNAIKLRKQDVREDTFRSSGAGGQHRNKTDSGVRLTHIPTGTVVTATEERSQHQNRAVAWRRLHEKIEHANLAESHRRTNSARQNGLEEFRSWTWCDWRDEVKGPNELRASMKRVLSGKLDKLVK